MFDAIARRYDVVNRVLSLGLDRSWRRAAARALVDSQSVLDVATGTGDLAIELARIAPHAVITGVDPSVRMLEVARSKLARHGFDDRVTLRRGDVRCLPIEDARFDAAAIAFGIRNVSDRLGALRELVRVVRPGGRVVILELGEGNDGILGRVARLHCRHIVPRIGALLAGRREYEYLTASVTAFPRPTAFAATMRDAGLVDVTVRPLAFGACTLFIGSTVRR